MVGGGEEGVGQGLWQACVADDAQNARLELAAGEPGLAGGRCGERESASVPVGACEEVVDRAVVVDVEALRLGERSFEPVGSDGCGDVEERAGDRGDRDASVRGRVTGNEGT